MSCPIIPSQKDYSFFPKTWVLPHDANDFKAQFDQEGHAKQVYIVKPDNSSKVRKLHKLWNIETMVRAPYMLCLARKRRTMLKLAVVCGGTGPRHFPHQ